jgi:hypothetical protein
VRAVQVSLTLIALARQRQKKIVSHALGEREPEAPPIAQLVKAEAGETAAVGNPG